MPEFSELSELAYAQLNRQIKDLQDEISNASNRLKETVPSHSLYWKHELTLGQIISNIIEIFRAIEKQNMYMWCFKEAIAEKLEQLKDELE